MCILSYFSELYETQFSNNEELYSFLFEQYNLPLPFHPSRLSSSCNGLKYNYGLFTQCNNPVFKRDDMYCNTCGKHYVNSGTPKYGTVQQRCEQLENFTDPNGRYPITYASYLYKNGYDINIVKDTLDLFNIQYDSRDFTKGKKTGRKKKNVNAMIENNEESDRDTQETNHQEILMQETNITQEKHNYEDIQVTVVKINNIIYLKDNENRLYDYDTHQEICL